MNAATKAPKAVAVIGAAVVLALFGLAASARFGPGSRQQATAAGGMAAGGNPLAAGQPVIVAQAAAQVPFHVYLPQTSAASDAFVTGAWIRTAWDPEIYVEYQSGIVLIEKQPVSSAPPSSVYQEQIAEGVPGQISTIDGQQVFVVPADTSGDKGSVNMVLNGTNIAVIGDNSLPASTLVSVASSIISSAQSQ